MTDRRNKNELLIFFHKIVDVRRLELALVVKNRRRCFLRFNGVVVDWNLSEFLITIIFKKWAIRSQLAEINGL